MSQYQGEALWRPGNVPVGSCLPDRVESTVEHEQEHGTNITTVSPVELDIVFGTGFLSGVLFLEVVAASPNDKSGDEEGDDGGFGLCATGESFRVKANTENPGTENLREIVEDAVEGTCSDIELGQVHTLEVIGVEPVAGEEHGEQKNDVPIRNKDGHHAGEFGFPGGVLHHDDLGAIVTSDKARVAEKGGEGKTQGHEDDETDIGAIVDLVGLGMDVLGQRNQTANNGAQIEDHPESGDVATLGLLWWIGHHDGALGRPQETGAHTEEGTGKDEETGILIVVVGKNGGNVQGIAEATEAQGQTETDPVGNAAGEEADDGESGIDGGVGIIDVVGIDLTGGTQAIDSVEHARAQEADDGDKDNLEPGTGICRKGDGAQLDSLVHPWLAFLSVGMVEGMIGGIVGRSFGASSARGLFSGHLFVGDVGHGVRGEEEGEKKGGG